MRRLPRINKNTADPELLQTYKDVRNERRSDWLLKALLIILGICVLGIICLALFQPSPMVVLIVAAACLVLIVGLLLFMAGWSPSSTRRSALLIVIGSLVFCAFAAWFIGWLQDLIFT